MAPDEHAGPDPLATIPGLVSLGLERAPIRTRESTVTLAAWRLSVSSARGPGAIDRVEIAGKGEHYRGQGVFLGWPQDRLRLAYARWMPANTAPEPDPGQLG